ncbi:serralysin [Glutamicibacter uratoxydans]|uniref:Serralysin n=1 Tax=Glutamicibacter uratoxydans TaxID=43667 RepID=A0A4Y4DLM7_GLUUR|nr:polyprenyl synthetase family protein [Glutamicibacter uratoxydans]GED06229.1 serralysin [Glutamicibacter uratoxydans]
MTLNTASDQHVQDSTRNDKLGFADQETLQHIVARLQSIADAAQARTSAYSSLGSELWERIGEFLSTGKLTRPALVLLGYRSFGGHINSRALDLACAFELLHTALIIHDDIIDRDFIRRGQPTLAAHYRDIALAAGRSSSDAEHAGNSAALIAGDLLINEAIKIAARAASGLESEASVNASFALAIEQAGAGELEDLIYSLKPQPATTGQVLRMEELKTAGYSFQLPLQAGALLAGAADAQAQTLGSIGCQLGVAYQVIDDVLGTFGDSGTTGKPVDSDLREFKSTVLLSLAAEDQEFSQLLDGYRLGQVQAEEIRRALDELGAEKFARQLAHQLCANATRSAVFLRLPVRAQHMLHDCTRMILQRSW